MKNCTCCIKVEFYIESVYGILWYLWVYYIPLGTRFNFASGCITAFTPQSVHALKEDTAVSPSLALSSLG